MSFRIDGDDRLVVFEQNRRRVAEVIVQARGLRWFGVAFQSPNQARELHSRVMVGVVVIARG